MSLTLYAIPNCDTVKKARKWLEANSIEYDFHDYKKQGVPAEVLGQACAVFGWEKMVNMKGMTWRRMEDAEKAAITDEASAIALMQEKSDVIKRPLVVGDAPLLLGFNEAEYKAALLQ